MAGSVFVERLDEVQAALAGLLKPLGFRRRGRTFNRAAEHGVVHVVNLQSGEFPVGDRKPLPAAVAHLRPDLYGRFAVNLGVFVEEIWACFAKAPPPAFIREYHCQIRSRLGSIAGDEDRWWHLGQPAPAILAEVGPALLAEGIGFVERFGTREAIVGGWVAANEGTGAMSASSRVDVAVILATRCEREEATRLLREQIARDPGQGHADYVRQLARELGLDAIT